MENNINIATKGDRHYRAGWIHISCPFCIGNPGFHLGWNIDEGFFNCWRCGYKRTELVISKILKLSFDQSKELLFKYDIQLNKKKTRKKREDLTPLNVKPNIYDLNDRCKRYIVSRGFHDPDILVDQWGIGYGGFTGELRHRITIPITHNDILVTYNGLRLSDKQVPKYKFYSKKTFDLNNILYGLDYCLFNYVFIVEGFVDAWKMGNGCSVALMGSGFSFARINLLLDFDYIFIMTDNDKQGRQTANRIKEEFNLLGKFSKILKYGFDDPGDMSLDQVAELKKKEISKLKGGVDG